MTGISAERKGNHTPRIWRGFKEKKKHQCFFCKVVCADAATLEVHQKFCRVDRR